MKMDDVMSDFLPNRHCLIKNPTTKLTSTARLRSSTPTTTSSYDVNQWISKLSRGCHLSEAESKLLTSKVKEILVGEPNLVQVAGPVKVVGDIHGQLADLLQILGTSGCAGSGPPQNFLFLGDYVDRGSHSVETIQLLLCLKLRYPGRITLLRGNHESRNCTWVFGFYDECLRKYGGNAAAAVWQQFTDLFDYLPVSGLIEGRILCMHGGLSPALPRLDLINSSIHRFKEVEEEAAMADLLWSDPTDLHRGWRESSRGAGHTFGEDVTRSFLHSNNLQLVTRAHQVVDEGFSYHHNQGLATVFSAPNYLGKLGNRAAIFQVQDNTATIIQFAATAFGCNLGRHHGQDDQAEEEEEEEGEDDLIMLHDDPGAASPEHQDPPECLRDTSLYQTYCQMLGNVESENQSS